MDAATGNERRPCDTPEPAAGVMRMSADDDEQADQQHKLADPGMAKTNHSVLDTLWQLFYDYFVICNSTPAHWLKTKELSITAVHTKKTSNRDDPRFESFMVYSTDTQV